MRPRRVFGGPRRFLGLPAPAKLNLFLHVLGRRADGYHEIQSVFVPLDLCDTLDVESRDDARIVRTGDLTGPETADLAVRAALALQAHARAAGLGADPALGATLDLRKRIPVGAGLGGGSSDAATTLIALNRLWDLDLPRAELARLARGLGADVPFFLGQGAAFVEGIGELCTPVAPPPAWYVVIYPQVHVSTAEIFSDTKLTRDHKRTTIAGFSAALQQPVFNGPESGAVSVAEPAAQVAAQVAAQAGTEAGTEGPGLFGSNDLEPVVRQRFPAVEAALALLQACAAGRGPVRMSGSGSAVFCMLGAADAAQTVLGAVRAGMPAGWLAWAVPALAELPLAQW